MKSFQNLVKLYLTFSTFTLITADIVPGKCPKVAGTTFNCSEIIPNFDQLESWHPQAHLLIYGLTPSSPQSKTLNLFGLDLINVSISDFSIILVCHRYNRFSENFFHIQCGASSKT